MPSPLPQVPCSDSPTCGDKVLVVNGDFHGRAFWDLYGNEILPGQMAWLNRPHAAALNLKNRFWKIVEDNT